MKKNRRLRTNILYAHATTQNISVNVSIQTFFQKTSKSDHLKTTLNYEELEKFISENSEDIVTLGHALLKKLRKTLLGKD